jgi:hypothetical protein
MLPIQHVRRRWAILWSYRQSEFLEAIQSDLGRPVPFAKIFQFTSDPNHFYISRHPGPHEGAFRDRHERRVGMRWTRVALLTRAHPCGRRSRVVLTPRRWRQVGDDASHHADDGGKKARSPGRARRKPLKPLRAGMPGDPGATVVTNACVLLLYTRGYGCNGHPAFPAPSLGQRRALCWAKDFSTTRALSAAGTRRCVCVPRMLRSAPLLRRGALLIRGPCSTPPHIGPGSAAHRTGRCFASPGERCAASGTRHRLARK